LTRYSLRLSFRSSPDIARLLQRSLRPEMGWRAEWSAKLILRRSTVIIEIASPNLSRLRAATNTVLHWMGMVEEVVDLLEEMG